MTAQLNPNIMRLIYDRTDKRTQARMRLATKDVLMLPAPARPMPNWQRMVRATQKRISGVTLGVGIPAKLTYAAMDLRKLMQGVRKTSPLTQSMVSGLSWFELMPARTRKPADPYAALTLYLATVNKMIQAFAASRGTPAQQSRQAQQLASMRRLEQQRMLSPGEMAKRAAAKKTRHMASRAATLIHRYGAARRATASGQLQR
jgi:hypothetical protein